MFDKKKEKNANEVKFQGNNSVVNFWLLLLLLLCRWRAWSVEEGQDSDQTDFWHFVRRTGYPLQLHTHCFSQGYIYVFSLISNDSFPIWAIFK